MRDVPREVRREALTEVRASQPVSRGMRFVRDADAFIRAEGNTGSRVIASANRILRGQRLWHVGHTDRRDGRDDDRRYGVEYGRLHDF